MLLEQAGLILLLAQLIKLTIVKSHRNYFTVDQYEGKSVRKFPTLLPRQLQNYFGNKKAFKLQQYIVLDAENFRTDHKLRKGRTYFLIYPIFQYCRRDLYNTDLEPVVFRYQWIQKLHLRPFQNLLNGIGESHPRSIQQEKGPSELVSSKHFTSSWVKSSIVSSRRCCISLMQFGGFLEPFRDLKKKYYIR